MKRLRRVEDRFSWLNHMDACIFGREIALDGWGAGVLEYGTPFIAHPYSDVFPMPELPDGWRRADGPARPRVGAPLGSVWALAPALISVCACIQNAPTPEARASDQRAVPPIAQRDDGSHTESAPEPVAPRLPTRTIPTIRELVVDFPFTSAVPSG